MMNSTVERCDVVDGQSEVIDLHATIQIDERDLNSSVVARFRRVVELLPADHVAYVDGKEVLTYRQVDALSDGVATLEVAHIGWGDGDDASQRVALLLPQESSSITAILGTLKAGHIYVPLDPSLTVASLQEIVNDSTPRLLLTVASMLEMAQAVVGANALTQVLLIDEVPTVGDGERVEVYVHDQAIISIQYTSGSTGRPRGIIRTHAQHVKSAYNLCIENGYCPSDHVAHLFSYAHGITTLVIFGALLHGATLYSHAARDFTPKSLYAWLESNQITQLSLSVGLIRALGELADSHAPLTTTRMLSTGGEAINGSAIRRMQQLLPPDCSFVIRLGASEAGSFTSLVVTPDMSWEGERVPVGFPLRLIELTILDDEGETLASPAVGEIAVRCRSLALGYWRQPEQTTAKFLPDPEGGDRRIFLTGDMGYFDANGMLVFLGRKDFMVKIRGFRVELEAVETALQALPSVQEAAVVAQELPSGEKRLVAYIVPRNLPNGAAATNATWREELAATLPAYMLPALLITLEKFARTISGKIDRKALPLPENQRPDLSVAYVAPRTETEAQLGVLWEDLLGINPIGAHDDFFALGGNSLLAMRMAVRVEQQWQKAVPTEFFLTPILAFLGNFLDGSVMEPMDVRAAPSISHVAANVVPAQAEKSLAAADKRSLFANPKLDLRRKLRYLPERAVLQMPFDQGWRWLQRYCSQTLVMRELYKHEVRRYVRMADEFAIPQQERAQAFGTHLASNIVSTLRGLELIQPLASNGLFDGNNGPRFFQTLAQQLVTTQVGDPQGLVRFTGIEILEAAYQRGQGVILLSFHTPSLRFAMSPLVRHLGVDGITTLSGGRAEKWLRTMERESSISTLPTSSTAFVAEVTHRAMQILRQGGLLQIVNDYGYDQQGTLPVAIGKRIFLLKPGFAELALATGAAVIPYYSTWQEDGRVNTVFLPPMAEPHLRQASKDEHQHVVQSMVESYAQFVEDGLRRMPEAWTWAVTSHYLQRPPRG